ncbi:hypothetical protein TNCV_4658051 [Trichonephila clavipes]|nr:hypothetical protein TNCV_4658051 [Trichonephila clavipes]
MKMHNIQGKIRSTTSTGYKHEVAFRIHTYARNEWGRGEIQFNRSRWHQTLLKSSEVPP